MTKPQISKIISGSSNKTSPLDPIPTVNLKKLIYILIIPISFIINKSLQSGIFPTKWKTARIIPHLKNKTLDRELKNYRPISALPILSEDSRESSFITTELSYKFTTSLSEF